jgi:hypothetical protein
MGHMPVRTGPSGLEPAHRTDPLGTGLLVTARESPTSSKAAWAGRVGRLAAKWAGAMSTPGPAFMASVRRIVPLWVGWASPVVLRQYAIHRSDRVQASHRIPCPACPARSGAILSLMNRPPTTQSVAGDSPITYGAILDDLRRGHLSYRQVARLHGVGASTVGGIARREGVRRPSGQQVAAAALRAGYHQAERIRLLDLAFARVELLLDEVDDARSLQQVVAALGVLVDRRRLEECEPAALTEVIDHQAARQALAEKLTRLATRDAGG